MKVVIVVPNFNGADIIGPCLDSLNGQSHKANVVVVDNGSTDGSAQIIKNGFPSVKLMGLAKNTGFTGAVNAGIEYAIKIGAEAVALLNNDAVADKDWLNKLVKRMVVDKKIGIVTGKLMRMDKKHFDSTGDNYSIYGLPFPRGRNQTDSGQYDKPEEVFAASGGASLYRVSMLKEVGLFDQRFFAYFEDVDISFRARLAAWTIWYDPAAVAYHLVGATSSKLGSFARYHSVKNFFILYTKNMPGILYFKYLPAFIYQGMRWLASSTLKGHLFSYLKGFCKFLILLPGVIKIRRLVQKQRKVTPLDIEKLLYKKRPPKIPKF